MFQKLTFLVSLTSATEIISRGIGYGGPGPHGSGYGFSGHVGNHNSHVHGHNHKNPWYHTVVHHKSANDYTLDPW